MAECIWKANGEGGSVNGTACGGRTHVHETICAKARRVPIGRRNFPDKLFGDDIFHLLRDRVERFDPTRLLDIYFTIASGSNIVVSCVVHSCRLAPNGVTAHMPVLKCLRDKQ